MNFLYSFFGSSNDSDQSQSRKSRRLKGRSLRMESLEERALLSISPTDPAAVQQLVPVPDYEVMDGVNGNFVETAGIVENAAIQQEAVDPGTWESAFASAVLGPDLAPVAPVGWESPLIVSTNPDAQVDDAVFVPGEPLYVRWAAQNIGGMAGDSGFEIALRVDGDIVWSNYYPSGIPSNYTLHQNGIHLPWLSVGEHTIELVVDPWNTLNETDETNNIFTKTIRVEGPQADLTPFAPEGWSAPLVLSTRPNAVVDGDLIRPYEAFYVTWGLKNIGNTHTESDFRVTLYVDGQEYWHLGYPAGLPANYFLQHRGIYISGLGIGEHTIEMRIDSDNTVSESNETNNVFTRTLTIVEPKADLTFQTPDGWDAPVLLTQEINGVAQEEFIEYQPIRLNACIANVGTHYSYGTSMEIWVDGQFYGDTGIDWLYDGGQFVTWDYNLYLGAGRHNVELRIDPGNYVEEADETNNVYSFTVDVTGPAPDLTPYVSPNLSSPLVCSNQMQSVRENDIYEGDTVYATFGMKNIGTATAQSGFRIALLVDGQEYWTNIFPPGLPIDYYLQYRGIEITGLAAGEHTLELRIDTDNSVAELNEDNNVYVRTLTVREAAATVDDLRVRFTTPETISLTWTSPVAAGNFTVQRSTDGENWTDVGRGVQDQPAWYYSDRNFEFDTTYYYRVVDGTNVSNIVSVLSPAQPEAVAVTNLAVTTGSRTDVALTWTGVSGYGLYYVVQRRESGSGDWTDIATRYTNSFKDVRPDADRSYDYRIVTHVYGGDTAVSETVTAEKLVSPHDLNFESTPSNWSGPVVLGKWSVYNEPSAYYTNDSLYVHFAFQNTGEILTASVGYKIYLDGTLKSSGTVGLSANKQSHAVTNFSLGTFAAGEHTLRIVLDEGNVLWESNEENNEFVKTFSVTGKPETPAGLAAEVLDAHGMKLTWDPVSTATAYKIEYSINGSWTGVTVTDTEYTFDSLRAHTGYGFRVSAINPAGTSATSASIYQATPWGTPESPTVSTSSIWANSIAGRVRFGNTHANVQTYTLEYALSPDGPWTLIQSGNVPTSGDVTYQVYDLSDATTYYFRAWTSNPLGDSTPTVISRQTLIAKPEAPTGLNAELDGETLRVSWDATPKADTYYVSVKKDDETFYRRIYSGADTSCTFEFADDAERYEFIVYARNSSGESSWSDAYVWTAPPKVVLPDLAFHARDGWTAPVVVSLEGQQDAGRTEFYSNEDYRFYYSYRNEGEPYDGAVSIKFYCDGVWKVTSTVMNFSRTGQSVSGVSSIMLTPGTHTITVVLDEDNLVEESNETNNTYTFTVTILGVPETAPEASAKLTSDDGAIDLTWNAVDYATSYTVQRRVAGGAWIDIHTGSETSYQDTDIKAEPGTTFEYRLKASNDGGESDWSVLASVTLPVAAPEAPDGLTLAVRSSSQIDVSWNAVEEATSYRVERTVSGSNSWTAVYGGSATEFSNSGLSANTSYVYRIVALKDGAESDSSQTATAKTQKNGTAAVPTGLQSTATSRTSITVSWGGGTTNVSGYVVQWSVDGTTWKSATVKKNVKTYNITGLTAGTEYMIRVAANSNAGQSGWSDAIAIQTPAPPVKPNAPTGLKLVSKTSKTAVISWTAPSSDLTGYRIEYSQNGSTWSSINVGAEATKATLSGLKSGKTYSIRIVAINGDVLSDYSAVLSVEI